MDKLVLDLPFLFADHHVTEVRRILLAISGVVNVYASSAYHLVEVTFDNKQVEPEAIKAALDKAGYLRGLLLPAEATSVNSNGHVRRTTDFDPTTRSLNFSRPAISEDQAAWPCPGLGLIKK
jgi:copper chaperone CopZ